MQQINVSGTLWVDGGFVTHKQSPPADVDVVLRAKDSVIDQLNASEQTSFSSLLTEHTEQGVRIQPMGGLVDAFFSPRSQPDRTLYWREMWSKVKAPDGSTVSNLEKGFLEVTL